MNGREAKCSTIASVKGRNETSSDYVVEMVILASRVFSHRIIFYTFAYSQVTSIGLFVFLGAQVVVRVEYVFSFVCSSQKLVRYLSICCKIILRNSELVFVSRPCKNYEVQPKSTEEPIPKGQEMPEDEDDDDEDEDIDLDWRAKAL